MMSSRIASLTALAALAVSLAAQGAEPTADAPPKDTSAPSAATAGPAVNTSPATPAKPAARPATGPATRQTTAGADRLNLDTTTVTGNRELPKVLYIVPWKKADIGELPAQPFNTLLDEVLTPVDRDVFRREVTYYGAIAGGAETPAKGAATAAPQPRGPSNGPSNGSEK